MGGHGPEDIAKLESIYKKVFYALLVLTVVTVAASYLHVPFWIGIVLGLAIASLKGSLVASFFMHLVWEKKMILWVLILTAIFAVAMMGLILWHAGDVPTYPH